MRINDINIGRLFLLTALCLLLSGLLFGILASVNYIFPLFLKDLFGFVTLRPVHVTSALFWIILGATGCIYSGLEQYTGRHLTNTRSKWQWALWMIAIVGIFYSYFTKDFGGRKYWEFNPIWALPILIAWVLFIINYIGVVRKIKEWPVYIWMWFTGVIFFLFVFIENYLWVFPYFRMHFITDTTIQWKVNGSLVGAWNQIIYGTAFFLMDKIEGNHNTGRSKLAFIMYFLGLLNLMFNWGHHIYTLPTENYIRYTGYIVSMTEWVFFLRIIYNWKKNLNAIQKHYHYFPYRFLMASDLWVFFNLGQAILMSIPAINIHTHGTHVTVAHAMGTTIGINTMILFAACFEFFNITDKKNMKGYMLAEVSFWFFQISLLVFWLSLNIAGILRGIWQLGDRENNYAEMMQSLLPEFRIFIISGCLMAVCILALVIFIFKNKNPLKLNS